jgi:hypothetical protein
MWGGKKKLFQGDGSFSGKELISVGIADRMLELLAVSFHGTLATRLGYLA